MEAIALGSMLAGGASAVAGAGTTALTIGSVVGAAGPVQPLLTLTLGQVAAGFGVMSAAVGMFSGMGSSDAAYDAQIAASRSALETSRVQFAETELASQREKTQAAIEEAERQRRLRRVLAEQKASFAGAGVDIQSGSPARIQEETVSEINRETRLSKLTSGQRVSSINRQGLGILASGAGKASSLIGQARTDRAASRTQAMGQALQIGQNIRDLRDVS